MLLLFFISPSLWTIRFLGREDKVRQQNLSILAVAMEIKIDAEVIWCKILLASWEESYHDPKSKVPRGRRNCFEGHKWRAQIQCLTIVAVCVAIIAGWVHTSVSCSIVLQRLQWQALDDDRNENKAVKPKPVQPKTQLSRRKCCKELEEVETGIGVGVERWEIPVRTQAECRKARELFNIVRCDDNAGKGGEIKFWLIKCTVKPEVTPTAMVSDVKGWCRGLPAEDSWSLPPVGREQ